MLIRQGRKMISLHNRAITYSTCNRNVYEWAVNASENTELERIERQIDQELMLEKINKFLNNFSEKTRKLIQMKSQGCGNKEISRQIGISVRGVNARFNLVRRAFLIRYGRNCHI
jgi:DNA-binding NarL/FixJ family response regulator